MRLRAKLFWSIGSLFFLIAILSYFLPTAFLKRDSAHFKERLDADAASRATQIIEQNKLVLSSFVGQIRGEINSLLYLISSSDALKQALPENSTSFHQEPWQMASHLIYFNDQVGFIQETHNGTAEAVILLDQTPIYLFRSAQLNKQLFLVQFEDQSPLAGIQLEPNGALILFDWSIFNSAESDWRKAYFAVDLGSGFASENASAKRYQDLLMTTLSASKKYLELQLASSHLSLQDWLDTKKLPKSADVPPLTNQEIDTPYGVMWRNWDSMKRPDNHTEPLGFFGRGMVDLFFADLALKDPFNASAPKGVVYLNQNRQLGFGLQSVDIFYKTPLFDDATFYKNHAPPDNQVPISTELALIESGNHLCIGSTLKLVTSNAKHEDYFTIGMRLSPLLRNLALSANVDVLLLQNGEILTAISSKGNSVPESILKQVPVESILGKDRGSIELNEKSFYYAKVQEDVSSKLSLYFLVSADETVYQQITEVEEQTKQALALQLLIIALFCLVVALIVLAYLSHRVTKPISVLAKATEEVAQGHYNTVALPESTNQNDEVAVLARSFAHMVDGLRDREKIRGVLNKVVSKEIAEEILKGTVHLGGEEKIVTILFADIRGFTKMTENFHPRDVIGLLNTFMTKMSRIIDEEGGVIDKYIGDEIMALYGAPIEQADSAYRALKTSVRMMRFLKEWNDERISQGRPAIEIGIGVHTGPVIAGNMGAEFRMNYTVLGATVNLASRLCSMAKPGEILTTEPTIHSSQVQASFEFKEDPAIEVRGFSKEIKTFSVIKLKNPEL
ncbi:MAG: adenylate/guanylate cyclase domain-containing protein [Parachlamydiales bacterium]|nr:adenylate/guanylate cyclase domain-containing protein [Parachlamydiales bacterium]